MYVPGGGVTWAKYSAVTGYKVVEASKETTVYDYSYTSSYRYFAETYAIDHSTGKFTITTNVSRSSQQLYDSDGIAGLYFTSAEESTIRKRTSTYIYRATKSGVYDSGSLWVSGYKMTLALSEDVKLKGDFLEYVTGKEGSYPDYGAQDGYFYVKILPEINPVFAKNDLLTIIAACQTDQVPDTWAIGDQTTIPINGVNYTIDIIGKYHDAYADGSTTAPLTFQLHDCYATTYRMMNANNFGGWNQSEMRNTHLPAILALMPTEVQSAIRKVKKLTAAGGMSTQIVENADKLFLLSEFEVFGTTTYSTAGEGSQYAYYAAGNSRVKNVNGSANIWNLRSPRKSNTLQFCNVDASGALVTNNSNTAHGVSFAFCF